MLAPTRNLPLRASLLCLWLCLPSLACATPQGPPPAAPRGAPVEALVPCPGKRILADWIQDAIHPSDAASVKVLGCAPGHFPAPGWAIVAEADSEVHQFIQDARSPAMLGQAALRADVGATLERVLAVDFDGDGVDELLDEFFLDRHGVATRVLFVLHRRGPDLDEALSLVTFSDNEQRAADEKDHDIYDAKATVGPVGKDGHRALIIEGALKRGHGAPEWIVGRAELVWKRGKLVRR